MSNSSNVTAIAHIEALLDDPMISLIMTIDRIDRDDARQLFCRVARRLKAGTAPADDRNGAVSADGIVFADTNTAPSMCGARQEKRTLCTLDLLPSLH